MHCASVVQDTSYIIYKEKYFPDDHFSYIRSPCYYMKAWIRILHVPSCYVGHCPKKLMILYE